MICIYSFCTNFCVANGKAEGINIYIISHMSEESIEENAFLNLERCHRFFISQIEAIKPAARSGELELVGGSIPRHF